MSVNSLEAITELLEQNLARHWEFQGESGFKLTPYSAEQVAYILNWAQINLCPVAINYPDACRMSPPVWLDLSGLDCIRQAPVEDFIIEVETGMTFGELQKELAKNWQTFPLGYASETTIADVLAEDRPALETGLRGAFRDYVLKTEIATPDGELTISGADVVKNATGYDLAKLYVGGRHAFGIVTSITLKLIALPQARRHWRFPVSSLQSACVLAEQLLSSSLPLTVCEICRNDGQWLIFTEFCGADWQMVELQATLGGTNEDTSHQAAKIWRDPQCKDVPQLMEESEGIAFRQSLETWPTDVTRLEIALPLSQWIAFAILVNKQSFLSNMRLQVRPAAGLIYISASSGSPSLPSAALTYLQNEAVAHGGFAQILQISQTDATILSEAVATLASFNLPTDPTVRHLLNSLKKGYDPEGVLHTPYLPLPCR